MEAMIEKLELYGYLLIFFSSFGGSFLGIVSAGVLSALGKMDLFLSIVLASSGNICGSMILVYLAKYQRKFFRSKKISRKIAVVYLWLRRYGIALIFANKYIYGFKSVLPLAVGVSGYSIKKFFFFNAISAFIWGALMGFAGFFASNLVIEFLQEWKKYPYVVPLLFVGLIIVLWCILNGKSRIKREKISS